MKTIQFIADACEIREALAIHPALAQRVFSAIVAARGLVRWEALALADAAKSPAKKEGA